ncbi:hypothetical protein [Micromonospora sp. AMSO1212t]|uniref:hypothetical protein n=1 Tax=Micromonospora sp. AMSO1212t TaxID=2650565 RepID=UPI00210822B8|nr:hypothetical protein [Micromonospora sp. AMSO1212t]
MIITEGTVVDHPASANSRAAPRIFGAAPLADWARVVDAVHPAGAGSSCNCGTSVPPASCGAICAAASAVEQRRLIVGHAAFPGPEELAGIGETVRACRRSPCG